MSEGEGLRQLGASQTTYGFDTPSKSLLETFDNKYPDRKYKVIFRSEEFTSLCPKTGQPDFATIIIEYEPGKKCIESKSLKLYLFSFRNCGSFMETIVNRIRDDLVSLCNPFSLKVVGNFKARGGITIDVTSFYSEESGSEF